MFTAFVQLMRNEKTAAREWTRKLSADSHLPVKHNRLLTRDKAHSINRNIIQLDDTSHSRMPVEWKMPIMEAELNFHEYVQADVM